MQVGHLRCVKWFLSHGASAFVDNAFASIHLDYCNSLFRNLCSICVNYNVSKILFLELYLILQDTPV